MPPVGAKAADLPAYSSFEATKIEENSYYDNPGWKRARQNKRMPSKPPQIEGKAKLVATNAPGKSAFKVGERVFHQKFGYGVIIGIEGDKIEVEFEKAGVKNVVSRFLSGMDDVPF